MKVLKYNTEFSQKAFGNKTGNRARKRGIYRCKSCGDEITIWLDRARLPSCPTCQEPVQWERKQPQVTILGKPGKGSGLFALRVQKARPERAKNRAYRIIRSGGIQ